MFAKRRGSPPRIHPLLLSLCLEYDCTPSGFVAEDNETVMSNPLYLSPENFPSLDVHLLENNHASSVSDADGLANSSTANCQKCMLSEQQNNSLTVGNVEISAEDSRPRHRRMSSSSVIAAISPKKKRKRHQRNSSSGVQGNCFIFTAVDFKG